MPWLNDLTTLIENAGVGTFGTNLFRGQKVAVPMIPSGSIVLTSTGGTSPDYIQNILTPARLRPTAQARIRADSLAAAMNKAMGVFDALSGVRNQTVNGNFYEEIRPMQSEPIDMGLDERGQYNLSLNFMGKKNRGT